MGWSLPWPKPATVGADSPASDEQPDGWQRHVEALRLAGIPEPGAAVQGRRPATLADEQPSEDGDFKAYLDPARHPFCLCKQD